MQRVPGLAFIVPRRAGNAGLKPHRHQLVIGGMEVDLVDAPAIAVIGRERRQRPVGLHAPGLRLRRAHLRAEGLQTRSVHADARPLAGRFQDGIGRIEVHILHRPGLVGDVVG